MNSVLSPSHLPQFLALLLCLQGWQLVYAQQPLQNAAEIDVSGLIQKLSSEGFADRQAALRELQNAGFSAADSLKTAEASASPAVQGQIRTLLTRIYRDEFQRRLRLLQADLTAHVASSLPEWDRFRAIVGETESDIRLYLHLLTSEQYLFMLRLFSPEELSEAIEQRSSALAKQYDGRADREFPAASTAALLLLGSNVETRLLRATSTNISSAMSDERFGRLIEDGVHRESMRKLLNSWISRPGIAAERPLIFAVEHHLEAGRTLSHRIIARRSARPDMLVAVLALGVLGDQSDLPAIENLFEVDTVLWPPRNQPVNRQQPDGQVRTSDYNVQTRDAALVIAAHLRGIPSEKLGLNVRPSAVTLYAADSLGFESAEQREAAFLRYRQLQELEE